MSTAPLVSLPAPTPRRSPLQLVSDVLRCAFEMKRALGAASNPTAPETIHALRMIAERY